MKITREELRAIIKEELKGSEELVQIQGVGTMERGQVMRSINEKLQDMIERNQRGDHGSLGQNQMNSLLAMWAAVSEGAE